MPAFAGPTSRASGIHPILCVGPAGPSRRAGGASGLVSSRIHAEAAAFGRRPRRAAARPGILPAQPSQRSAAFAPLRASVYVTRIAAPLPSSTSLPQLSQTSTVLRANLLPPGVSAWTAILTKRSRVYPAVIRAPRNALAGLALRESSLSSISAFAPECATTPKPILVRSPDAMSGLVPPTTLSSIMHSE